MLKGLGLARTSLQNNFLVFKSAQGEWAGLEVMVVGGAGTVLPVMHINYAPS